MTARWHCDSVLVGLNELSHLLVFVGIWWKSTLGLHSADLRGPTFGGGCSECEFPFCDLLLEFPHVLAKPRVLDRHHCHQIEEVGSVIRVIDRPGGNDPLKRLAQFGLKSRESVLQRIRLIPLNLDPVKIPLRCNVGRRCTKERRSLPSITNSLGFCGSVTK